MQLQESAIICQWFFKAFVLPCTLKQKGLVPLIPTCSYGPLYVKKTHVAVFIFDSSIRTIDHRILS